MLRGSSAALFGRTKSLQQAKSFSLDGADQSSREDKFFRKASFGVRKGWSERAAIGS